MIRGGWGVGLLANDRLDMLSPQCCDTPLSIHQAEAVEVFAEIVL
ncbi:hypothetical protein [Mesorhizobium sp. M0664]